MEGQKSHRFTSRTRKTVIEQEEELVCYPTLGAFCRRFRQSSHLRVTERTALVPQGSEHGWKVLARAVWSVLKSKVFPLKRG